MAERMPVVRRIEVFRGYVGGTPYEGPALVFHCPGCGFGHWFGVGPGGWTWNGSMDAPTARPSLLNNAAGHPAAPRCHLFVTDGALQFLSDSTHALAGQTVPMEPEE